MPPKGGKATPEHRARIAAALKGHPVAEQTRRKLAEWRTGRRFAARGPKTKAKQAAAAWKGESVGYTGAHERVARVRGKPARCEHCGRTDNAVKYEWATVTRNYANPWDYIRLCVPCHRAFDRDRRREAKTAG